MTHPEDMRRQWDGLQDDPRVIDALAGMKAAAVAVGMLVLIGMTVTAFWFALEPR